jgi:hypothetical protein
VLGLDVSAEEVNAGDGPTKLAPFGGRESRSWLERVIGIAMLPLGVDN